jgi:outer membrane protein
MKNNTVVLNAELQSRQAAAALGAALLRFTPSLSASVAEDISIYGGQLSPSTSMGAGGSITLFNGLSNYNNYRKSEVQCVQSAYEKTKSGKDVSIQIISAYLDILTNRERLVYLEQVLESAQAQLAEGNAKMLAGSILPSDYQMLDASFQRAQCDVENARISITVNTSKLRKLMGLEPVTVIEVLPLVSEDTMTLVLPTSDALKWMPEMRISELEVQKAQYDLKMAKGGYLPSLGLNAYASVYGGDNQRTDGSGYLIANGGLNTNVSLGLSIPILQQGMNRTQVKQSQLALQQAVLQQEETRREIVETMEERYYSALQARNSYAASNSVMRANESTYRVMQAKYKAGSISTVDLLRQQESYLNSVNDYLQNKYTYVLSIKILNIYLGRDSK